MGMGKPPFLLMAHRLHRSHRFCLAGEEGFKCPAEPMEQREQNHVLHELCRVATEEDESQIKEITEMLTGQVLL